MKFEITKEEKTMKTISEIDSIMRAYFPTEQQFEDWMLKKNRHLNFQSPNKMIEDGKEAELREFIFLFLDK